MKSYIVHSTARSSVLQGSNLGNLDVDGRWKGSRASLFWGDFRLFEKGPTAWQKTHNGGTSSVITIGGHRSVTTDSAMTTTLRSRVVPAADTRLSA